MFLEFVSEENSDGVDVWSNLVDGGGSFALVHGLQVDGSLGRVLEAGGDWIGGLGISKRW
jgi:hypothetical protein